MTGGLAQLQLPASWRTLDFISDVHLDVGAPQTHGAWSAYMASTPADALFILGDLFEVWVGDDLLEQPQEHFAAQCALSLRQAGQRLKLFFMHGNRDFLVGAALLARCHATLLADPCLLRHADQSWLLSHGDALCLDDAPYLAFRQQVRSASWQEEFLARPLSERQALARQMRERSQQQQAQRWADGGGYAEVDAQAARSSLQQAGSSTLIHGHTHRPARHELGQGLAREVLSDWDAAAEPPRAQVLRLSIEAGQPARLERLNLA
jgi:UDP-2,3-diacylglucosamine hydrolase